MAENLPASVQQAILHDLRVDKIDPVKALAACSAATTALLRIAEVFKGQVLPPDEASRSTLGQARASAEKLRALLARTEGKGNA